MTEITSCVLSRRLPSVKPAPVLPHILALNFSRPERLTCIPKSIDVNRKFPRHHCLFVPNLGPKITNPKCHHRRLLQRHHPSSGRTPRRLTSLPRPSGTLSGPVTGNASWGARLVHHPCVRYLGDGRTRALRVSARWGEGGVTKIAGWGGMRNSSDVHFL